MTRNRKSEQGRACLISSCLTRLILSAMPFTLPVALLTVLPPCSRSLGSSGAQALGQKSEVMPRTDPAGAL
jgi:hypothetical protein